MNLQRMLQITLLSVDTVASVVSLSVRSQPPSPVPPAAFKRSVASCVRLDIRRGQGRAHSFVEQGASTALERAYHVRLPNQPCPGSVLGRPARRRGEGYS